MSVSDYRESFSSVLSYSHSNYNLNIGSDYDLKSNFHQKDDDISLYMDLNKVKYEFAGGERGGLGDSPLVHLDTKKANSYGWEPKISIEDSIRNTVKYLLSSDSTRFR